MLGNGDGTFKSPLGHDTDLSSGALIVDDFDRDGRPDVEVALCCGTTDMMELLGNGDGTFRESHYPNGGSAIAVAAADFNADGRTDLVALNAPDGPRGSVAVLENGLSPVTLVSAASNALGNVAPDSIVTAYGFRLANEVAGVSTPDWPAMLGGTTVKVRDAKGAERDARIAYASSGQVNFLLPPETAPGLGSVKITSGSGVVTESLIGVQDVAPGLFFTNAERLAAAFIIRVRAGGEQIVEQVVQVENGELVAAPIDLSNETDQVVLLLFGTGIRGRSDPSAVRVMIGGVAAPVQYAGPQGEFPGLDQINVLVPQTLRGRGLVDVVLTAGESAANTVKLRFQ